MPISIKLWQFENDLEGFVASDSGDAVATYDGSTQYQSGGSAHGYVVGRNNDGIATFEWTGTFEDLGVPAGREISDVNELAYYYSSYFFTGNESSVEVSVLDGADNVLETITRIRTSSSGWLSASVTETALSPHLQSSDTAKVRITLDLDTANDKNAIVEFWVDNISVQCTHQALIQSTATTGGSISPSGDTLIAHGGNSAEYTFSPDNGYVLNDVEVDGVSQGAISSYAFTEVTEDHTIHAIFVPAVEYEITATSGANGTIDPSGAIMVYGTMDQTFTFHPDAEYYIDDVLVDGVSQGAIETYTFENVQSDHTIHVDFIERPKYVISATSGDNGNINPSGDVEVHEGFDKTFSFIADTNYIVSDVTVNGISQGALTEYTFTDVQQPHTIHATFVFAYTIEVTSSSGGSASPEGVLSFAPGDSLSITFSPNVGYLIHTVFVDGVSQGAISSYTFNDIQDNHFVHVVFVEDTEDTVFLNDYTGGTGTGNQTYPLRYGDSNPSYTALPQEATHVVAEAWSSGGLGGYGDGGSAGGGGGAGGKYGYGVFEIAPDLNIEGWVNYEIRVSNILEVTNAGISIYIDDGRNPFSSANDEIIKFGISGGQSGRRHNLDNGVGGDGTVISRYPSLNVFNRNDIMVHGGSGADGVSGSGGGGGGSASKESTGKNAVDHNAVESEHDGMWSGEGAASRNTDGGDASLLKGGGGGGATSTSGGEGSRNLLHVSYIVPPLDVRVISAYSSVGGTVTPSGDTFFDPALNESQTFSFTPDSEDYVVGEVFIDGVSQGSIYSYTFTDIQQDHFVYVSFILAQHAVITATAGLNGTIDPSGDVEATISLDKTFYFIPDTGYEVADVVVDGVSQGALSSYTFVDVQQDHTIHVTFFALAEFYVTATSEEGGTLDPTGTVLVYEGYDITFDIIAYSGYAVEEVFIDDVSQGALTEYTFTDVQQDHTIHVTFQMVSYIFVTPNKFDNSSIAVFRSTGEYERGISVGENPTFSALLSDDDHIYGVERIFPDVKIYKITHAGALVWEKIVYDVSHPRWRKSVLGTGGNIYLESSDLSVTKIDSQGNQVTNGWPFVIEDLGREQSISDLIVDDAGDVYVLETDFGRFIRVFKIDSQGQQLGVLTCEGVFAEAFGVDSQKNVYIPEFIKPVYDGEPSYFYIRKFDSSFQEVLTPERECIVVPPFYFTEWTVINVLPFMGSMCILKHGGDTEFIKTDIPFENVLMTHSGPLPFGGYFPIFEIAASEDTGHLYTSGTLGGGYNVTTSGFGKIDISTGEEVVEGWPVDYFKDGRDYCSTFIDKYYGSERVYFCFYDEIIELSPDGTILNSYTPVDPYRDDLTGNSVVDENHYVYIASSSEHSIRKYHITDLMNEVVDGSWPVYLPQTNISEYLSSTDIFFICNKLGPRYRGHWPTTPDSVTIFYVFSATSIFCINSEGSILWHQIGLFDQIFHYDVDGAGNIWVTGNVYDSSDDLVKVSPLGVVLYSTRVYSHSLTSPEHSVTVSGDGNFIYLYPVTRGGDPHTPPIMRCFRTSDNTFVERKIPEERTGWPAIFPVHTEVSMPCVSMDTDMDDSVYLSYRVYGRDNQHTYLLKILSDGTFCWLNKEGYSQSVEVVAGYNRNIYTRWNDDKITHLLGYSGVQISGWPIDYNGTEIWDFVAEGGPIVAGHSEVTYPPIESFLCLITTSITGDGLITVDPLNGGYLGVDGTVDVPEGRIAHFEFVPGYGNIVGEVFLDSVSQGAVSELTLGPVSSAHLIEVVFEELPVFYVTITSNIHGSASPEGSVEAPQGLDFTVNFIPDRYNAIQAVYLDDVIVEPTDSSYTIPDVQSSHTLHVDFVVRWAITSSRDVGVEVIPFGRRFVTDGLDFWVFCKNSQEYQFLNKKVNGISHGPLGAHHFKNVRKDYHIHFDSEEIAGYGKVVETPEPVYTARSYGTAGNDDRFRKYTVSGGLEWNYDLTQLKHLGEHDSIRFGGIGVGPDGLAVIGYSHSIVKMNATGTDYVWLYHIPDYELYASFIGYSEDSWGKKPLSVDSNNEVYFAILEGASWDEHRDHSIYKLSSDGLLSWYTVFSVDTNVFTQYLRHRLYFHEDGEVYVAGRILNASTGDIIGTYSFPQSLYSVVGQDFSVEKTFYTVSKLQGENGYYLTHSDLSGDVIWHIQLAPDINVDYALLTTTADGVVVDLFRYYEDSDFNTVAIKILKGGIVEYAIRKTHTNAYWTRLVSNETGGLYSLDYRPNQPTPFNINSYSWSGMLIANTEGQDFRWNAKRDFAVEKGHVTTGKWAKQTVTSSAGVNGSISPDGAFTTARNANIVYEITPDAGYKIDTIAIDSVLQDIVYSPYILRHIQGDYSLHVTFTEAEVFTITASAGLNGSISPSGDIPVTELQNETFTISPDSGYVVSQVWIDGVVVGAITEYTFDFVQSDHSIYAEFELYSDVVFIITATSDDNGFISPSGSVEVDAGDDAHFVFVPDSGYRVENVFIDGYGLGPLADYTFSNVSSNSSIHVTFEEAQAAVPPALSMRFSHVAWLAYIFPGGMVPAFPARAIHSVPLPTIVGKMYTEPFFVNRLLHFTLGDNLYWFYDVALGGDMLLKILQGIGISIPQKHIGQIGVFFNLARMIQLKLLRGEEVRIDQKILSKYTEDVHKEIALIYEHSADFLKNQHLRNKLLRGDEFKSDQKLPMAFPEDAHKKMALIYEHSANFLKTQALVSKLLRGDEFKSDQKLALQFTEGVHKEIALLYEHSYNFMKAQNLLTSSDGDPVSAFNAYLSSLLEDNNIHATQKITQALAGIQPVFLSSETGIFLDGRKINPEGRTRRTTITYSENNVHNEIVIESNDPELFEWANPKVHYGEPRIEAKIGDRLAWFLLEEREGESTDFTITGISVSGKEDGPYSEDLHFQLEEATLASEIAESLTNYCPVEWEAPDWVVPKKFEFSGKPIEGIQRLASEVGAIVRCQDDGSLLVRKKRPVRPIHMDAANPDVNYDRNFLITLRHLEEPETGYNAVEITGVTAEDFIPVMTVEGTPHMGDVSYIRVYWSGKKADVVDTLVTDGVISIIGHADTFFYEIVEEVLDFVDHKALAQFPVYEILAIEWEGVSGGNVTHDVHSKDLFSFDRFAVARVKYRTRFQRYMVEEHNVEKLIAVLFLDREPDLILQIRTEADPVFGTPVIAPLLTTEYIIAERGKAWIDEQYRKSVLDISVPFKEAATDGKLAFINDAHIGEQGNYHIVSCSIVLEGPKILNYIGVERCLTFFSN